MSKVNVTELNTIQRIHRLQEAAEELGYEHWSDIPEDENDAIIRYIESEYEDVDDETL